MRGHALVGAFVAALTLGHAPAFALAQASAAPGLTQTQATPRVGTPRRAQATPRMGSTSPSGRALDSLTNSVTRPLPTLPAPPTGQHSADVWVPDRIVPVPDQPGGVIVPGHWERRIAPHQHYVPPMVVTTPDGRVVTVPGGIMPPPEQRQTP